MDSCKRSKDERRKAVEEAMKKLSEKLEEKLKETLGINNEEDEDIYPVQATLQTLDGVKKVWIVNPMIPAWKYHERYLDLIQEETKVLFVGVNSARKPPTGIPFYENDVFQKVFKGIDLDARYLKWMGSQFVEDSDSGEIFWGCMRQYFSSREEFFRDCFVINYCPLIFTDEERTSIIPLSCLNPDEPIMKALEIPCRNAFQEVVKILKPSLIVTMGQYTKKRVPASLQDIDRNYHLRHIWQPIAVALAPECKYSPSEVQTNEWKSRVDFALSGVPVWREITKGIQSEQDIKVKGEEDSK